MGEWQYFRNVSTCWSCYRSAGAITASTEAVVAYDGAVSASVEAVAVSTGAVFCE